MDALFKDVINPTLRNWNRVNVFYNIKEFRGNAVAMDYIKKFNKKDKVSILTLMNQIANDGYENVRRNIIRMNNA